MIHQSQIIQAEQGGCHNTRKEQADSLLKCIFDRARVCTVSDDICGFVDTSLEKLSILQLDDQKAKDDTAVRPYAASQFSSNYARVLTSGYFVVMRPRTTTFPLGRCLKGSNVPDLSSSYSSYTAMVVTVSTLPIIK